MAEKRTEQFAMRFSPELLEVLRRRAEQDERTTADYIHRVLSLHAWGVEGNVSAEESASPEDRALPCNARKMPNRA